MCSTRQHDAGPEADYIIRLWKKERGINAKNDSIAEVSVKTLVRPRCPRRPDRRRDLEALHQDEEVEVKVTAEFVKVA